MSATKVVTTNDEVESGVVDQDIQDGWLQRTVREKPKMTFAIALVLFVGAIASWVLAAMENTDTIEVPVLPSVCPSLTLSRDLGTLVSPLVSPDKAHIVRIELDQSGFPVFHLNVFDPVLDNFTERLPSISSAAFIPTPNPAGLKPLLHFAVNDTELVFVLCATQVFNGQGVAQFFKIRFDAWAQSSANSARSINIVARKVPEIGGLAFDAVAGVWCTVTNSSNAAEVSVHRLSADLGSRTLIATAQGILTSTEARSLHLITDASMILTALSPSDSAICFLYQFQREANNSWVPTDDNVVVPNNFFVNQVKASSDGTSLFTYEIGLDNQRGQVRVFAQDSVTRIFSMTSVQTLVPPNNTTTNFGSALASHEEILFVQSMVNSSLQVQIFQRTANGLYTLSSVDVINSEVPFVSSPNNLLSSAGVVSMDSKITFVGSNGSLSGPVSYRLSCGSA